MERATVKATCDACGLIETTSDKVRLLICGNDPARNVYRLDCPRCGQMVQKPADDHAVSMLMLVGIRAEVWALPPEAFELHDGPPIGYDDILDFAVALGGTDVWAELS